jgi:hypothetical protein
MIIAHETFHVMDLEHFHVGLKTFSLRRQAVGSVLLRYVESMFNQKSVVLNKLPSLVHVNFTSRARNLGPRVLMTVTFGPG